MWKQLHDNISGTITYPAYCSFRFNLTSYCLVSNTLRRIESVRCFSIIPSCSASIFRLLAVHECAKCGAIFDSQSNLNRQSRAHGDGGHQGQLDDKRATAWKNYHSSVDQGETRSVSSQLKIPPTELTVSSQQFAVLRNATAEMANSAEDLDSPPVTSSDGPIMAFLSNASLAADLIESRASSAGICPQQSLELSEQSRALVDALDSWVQRADSGGPSPQDFYASRELKGSVLICSIRFQVSSIYQR
jgi:hypothetical protein